MSFKNWQSWKKIPTIISLVAISLYVILFLLLFALADRLGYWIIFSASIGVWTLILIVAAWIISYVVHLVSTKKEN